MSGNSTRFWFLYLSCLVLIFNTLFDLTVRAESIPLASFIWTNEDRMRVGRDASGLFIQLMARKGEGEYGLALRVLHDGPYRFSQFRAYLREREFSGNRYLTLPLQSLNASIQAKALCALFPKDHAGRGGWQHQVVYVWENLELLADAFLKSEIPSKSLVESNSRQKNLILHSLAEDPSKSSLERGAIVIFPWEWIREDLNLRPVPLKQPLRVTRDAKGRRFASYRMLPGETLYSNIVLRFTDYVGHDQVNRAVGDLMLLNRLDDVRSIPTGTLIRIPLEWISINYRHEVPGIHEQPEPALIQKKSSSPRPNGLPCVEPGSCEKIPRMELLSFAEPKTRT